MKNWRVAPGQHATFWHCENLCILHTLLWSGNICASVYRGRNRKKRTKQLTLWRIQKQCSLIPKLFHYVEQQENRRKKKKKKKQLSKPLNIWNILSGIQTRSEYFSWVCQLAKLRIDPLSMQSSGWDGASLEWNCLVETCLALRFCLVL